MLLSCLGVGGDMNAKMVGWNGRGLGNFENLRNRSI
jgi:hypothetical protein